jgi:hypothetical protein
VQRLLAPVRRLRRGALVEPVVDRQGVHAEPPEQGGQHERGGAAAGVDDDLGADLGDPRGVDAAEQLERIGLHHPRREREVPDLPRERAPELAASDDALELALGRLGQVGATVVEKDDVHALGLTGGGADDHSSGASLSGLQARDRDWDDLEVDDVDGARCERRDHRALQGTRCP